MIISSCAIAWMIYKMDKWRIHKPFEKIMAKQASEIVTKPTRGRLDDFLSCLNH